MQPPLLRRKLTRSSSIRLLLMAALTLTVISVAILATPQTMPAQETLAIKGRVVNGTSGGEIPGDLTVLMLVTGPDGTLSGTGQVLAEPDGSFEFDAVSVVPGGSYTISVDYESVFYGQTLLSEQLVDEVLITVYEPTEDAGIIHVERQVMVISGFDLSERTATATEFVRFTNPTDTTLRPNLETARPGMFSFMRFALPPEASGVTVQSNLRGGEIISVGSGFALTAAVPPGEHSVDFAYTFPYQGGSLDYRNSLPQGADIFQVLVPARWESVNIDGLTARPPVGIADQVYRAWEGRDIPPGPGVQLSLSGLPEPGVLARVGNALSGGSFWTTAIPSATGAALLALLLLGLLRRQSPAAHDESGAVDFDGTGPQPSPAARAEIVASLAALDEGYQSGNIDQYDYLHQRASLVSRALGHDSEPGE